MLDDAIAFLEEGPESEDKVLILQTIITAWIVLRGEERWSREEIAEGVRRATEAALK